jgi:hypothetical protein
MCSTNYIPENVLDISILNKEQNVDMANKSFKEHEFRKHVLFMVQSSKHVKDISKTHYTKVRHLNNA